MPPGKRSVAAAAAAAASVPNFDTFNPWSADEYPSQRHRPQLPAPKLSRQRAPRETQGEKETGSKDPQGHKEAQESQKNQAPKRKRRSRKKVRFEEAESYGGGPLRPSFRQPEFFTLDPAGGPSVAAQTMATPPTLFHTLLRPVVLQLLRAQGYHATRTSVADALTDLAGRYLAVLCERTAAHMAHGGDGVAPQLVDVRMALEDVGALLPEDVFEEQEWRGEEDEGAVADFVKWFSGPRSREIRRIALDGEEESTDYLSALKKRHSKTGEDTKYNGTVLGKGTDHGEVLVEGGEFTSIQMWQEKMKREKVREKSPSRLPTPEEDSRPPSSALSSLGDRTIADEEMDLS